jgi:hypothetical protein
MIEKKKTTVKENQKVKSQEKKEKEKAADCGCGCWPLTKEQKKS